MAIFYREKQKPLTPSGFWDGVVRLKVGLTRYVEILNPTTGKLEMRPLNEIISSHAGRRTFVGNAYLMVQDPNLIGKMSGHTDGSRAFARYRNIEDATLRTIIEKME